MPSKKKRTATCDSEDGSSASVVSMKRRKKDFCVDICQEIFDSLRNQKTSDGRLFGEIFSKVPNRRADPGYYETVDNPVDLAKIQLKLKNNEYIDVDQMTEDVQLIVDNTQKYYEAESQEHSDASELLEVFEQVKMAVLSRQDSTSKEATPEPSNDPGAQSNFYLKDALTEEDSKSQADEDDGDGEDEEASSDEPRRKRRCRREMVAEMGEEDRMILRIRTRKDDSVSRDDQSSSTAEDDQGSYEEILGTILEAKEGDRRISELFKVLPPRETLPQYYDIIKDPMDLRTVAQKVQQNGYTSLDDMMKDVYLMIQNAKYFNEPGSQIYKDAITLRKLVSDKRSDLQQGKVSVPKPARGRPRIHPLPKPSETLSKCEFTEALILPSVVDNESIKTQGETCEDSETEGSILDCGNSPYWALFNVVYRYTDPIGTRLCEPFLRLPNKRMYPDYYEEIKKPLSLLKIKTRIKDNKHKSLEQLHNELTRVFDNARHYNVEDSKIHQDAVTLQNLVDEKYKELCGKEESSSDILALNIKKNRRWAETASMTSEDGSSTPKRKLGRKSSLEDPLKRRLWALFKSVYDYQMEGRHLVKVFLTLPSRKEYPNYYQVISEPIDMGIIENKIKEDKYSTDQQLVEDLELMFHNAKHYNEENSQIYRDADTLERALRARVKYLHDGSPVGNKSSNRISDVLTAKLYDLYNTIKDHTDPKGRVLSTPFMKLPQKSELPDYYEVIRKPIDMMKINQRLNSNQYPALEELAAEFVLMFENACRYNEPDSLIYKDALTLQRVCMEKKQELSESDDTVPDVRAQVQELMMTVYVAVYNQTDEEGRCLSDSFQELPTLIERSEDGKASKKVLTFEQIKRNLTKGRYRRMDRFQDDMLQVFEHARQVSRTDSQIYEDAVDLELFYLKVRDEVCRNGEILLTPALSYTIKMFQGAVEKERKDKSEREQAEDIERKRKEESSEKEFEPQEYTETTSLVHTGQTYDVGQFVYIESREADLENHIVCIEKLWKDSKGENWLRGNFYLRPQETFHLATKKFLEKEVFKSDRSDNIPLSKVIGKCIVLGVKEFYRYKPEGYPVDDTYVCESRYTTRHRLFKKLKQWTCPRLDSSVLVPRTVPLEPIRVASVFAEGNESEDKPSEVFADYMDKSREVVEAERPADGQEGCEYYEQLVLHCGWLKLGDFVYVDSGSAAKLMIVRIDRMWTTPQGLTYIYGITFVSPSDTEHLPTRTFYEQEVFRTTSETVHLVNQIIGRCVVMSLKEYVSCRVTEIAEEHVFICEAKYLEQEKVIKRFKQPFALIKMSGLSVRVCDDEIYFFKKLIVPRKVSSPLLLQSTFGLDDPSNSTFMDTADVSFSEGFSHSFMDDSASNSLLTTPNDTPSKTPKKKGGKKGVPKASGYICFSTDVRKDIMNKHKDMSFGEISRLVGQMWKDLPKDKKEPYEVQARKMQAEIRIKQQKKEAAAKAAAAVQPCAPPVVSSPVTEPQSPSSSLGAAPSHHTPVTPTSMQVSSAGYSSYGPVMYTQQQLAFQQPAAQSTSRPGLSSPGLQQQAPIAPARPPSPQFVPVPPRTQKIMHSEAYLRYIENLTNDTDYISDWRKQLSATQDNSVPVDPTKLPVNWLGPGHTESAVTALWALRDLMMKDTLLISRTLDYTEF